MAINRERFALGTFPYCKYSLDYALDSLERLGARSIELYAAEPHFYHEDLDVRRLGEIKSKLRGHGLEPICLTPEQMKYPINICSGDSGCRRRSVESMLRYIDLASELSCPIVLVHAGYPLNDEDSDGAWARSAESLSLLAETAGHLGVTLAMEVVDVRWKTLIRDFKAAAKMISELGVSNLKAMLDTMTLVYGGESVGQAMDCVHGDIVHCHFSDGWRSRRLLAHLIPGEGEIDLRGILDGMDERGYSGFVSVELMAGFEEAPERALRKSLDWIDAYCNNSANSEGHI